MKEILNKTVNNRFQVTVNSKNCYHSEFSAKAGNSEEYFTLVAPAVHQALMEHCSVYQRLGFF